MKDGKLQVALIGCGMIGHGHAEGIARDGRAEIAAVVYGKNKAAAWLRVAPLLALVSMFLLVCLLRWIFG